MEENTVIKNELISIKANQKDSEDKIKNSIENEQKIEQILKKFNFQVENWKYKFKCLEQKIADLESIEKQARSMADSLLSENQNLRSIILHHECDVHKLQSNNEILKKEFQEKIDQLSSQNEKLSNLNLDSESKIGRLNEQLLIVIKINFLNFKFFY